LCVFHHGPRSFDAVQAARFPVRAVARELVPLTFSPSRTNQPQGPPPSIDGDGFERCVVQNALEARRAGPVVVGEIRVERLPDTEQCSARFANARLALLP